MNSPVWHILKKDLRRFLPLLSLWCVALVARVSLPGLFSGREFSAASGVPVLSAMLVMLLNAHLVVRLLAEDSPLKEAAFWRMRPVTGRQMITAKLLFIAAWTLILPVVVMVAAGRAYGFTAEECVAVAAGQLLLHAVIGGLFLMVSIFTQRVWASVLGLWLLLMVGGVLFSSLYIGRVRGGVGVPGTAEFDAVSLMLSRGVVAGVVLLAACSIAIGLVYRERRRVAAAATVIVAAAGMKLTVAAWSWDYLGWMPVLQRCEAQVDSRYTGVLTNATTSGRSTIDDVTYRQVFASIKWSGLTPENVCVIYRAEGDVVWPDGGKTQQGYAFPSASGYDLTGGLKALGVAAPRISRYHQRDSGVTLVQLNETDMARLKRAPAEWRGRLSAAIGKLEPEFRVPLRAGGSIKRGATQVSIAELEFDRDQVKLKIQERRPDLPKWTLGGMQPGAFGGWAPQMYALINTHRNEALLSSGGGGGGGSNDGFLSFRKSQVSFSSSDRGPSFNREEWVEWLGEAELVRFRFVEERRVAVDAQVPITYSP